MRPGPTAETRAAGTDQSGDAAHPGWVLPREVAQKALLGLLFALLVGLELVPILGALKFKTLWFMNNFEDYTWSFWPPLKTQLRGSYFYQQTGFFYWVLLRPLHWVAESLLGGKVVTVEYMQVFGYLARGLFSLMTVSVAAWVLLSKGIRWIGKVVIFLFMLSMVIGTFSFFWIYHMRLGVQLSYKLFQAVAFVLLIKQLERIFEGREGAGRFPVLTGIFCGLVFFEMPLYSYLGLFLVANLLGAVPAQRRIETLDVVVRGVIAAGAGLLLFFYYGDLRSIWAALVSHFSGIVKGFPQGQPGFQEDFINRFLSLDSPYFLHQVILIAGAMMALLSAASYLAMGEALRRQPFDATMLRLSLIYLFSLAMHLNVMRTRGGYTIVFSAVFLTFLYMPLMLYVLLRRGALRVNWAFALSTAGVTPLLLIALLAYNFNAFGMHRFGSFRPASVLGHLEAGEPTNRAVSAYDNFLGEIASQYTVYYSHELSPCLVAWQYVLAEYFHHVGAGHHGFDLRYSGMFQRERYPSVELRFPDGLEEVKYQGGRFRFKVVPNPPRPPNGTVIIPVGVGSGERLLRRGEKEAEWVEYEGVKGRAKRLLVEGYPKTALFWRNLPWRADVRRWVTMPVSAADAISLGAKPAEPAIKAGYLPFLGSLCGTYHLLLIRPGDEP